MSAHMQIFFARAESRFWVLGFHCPFKTLAYYVPHRSREADRFFFSEMYLVGDGPPWYEQLLCILLVFKQLSSAFLSDFHKVFWHVKLTIPFLI